ncbi:DUF934 domain-containing protein [Pseudorhodoplanes sp.]|uniref:DUF934 domain-containing protein n=1 Tax=Pseudorhodoplanes sp. TaxID=1934341 RepID=UPI00391DBB57
MPLIRNGETVEDPFLRVEDDAPLPPEGAVLLTATQFMARAEEAAGRAGPTGVIWPNDRDVAELAPWLDRLAMIALVFPTFKDGRAYSQARTLRERLGFTGELRATGDVLRDQFLFLHRAGFDAFEVRKPEDAKAFCEVLQRYNVFYQPAADGTPGALRRRLFIASRPRAGITELA